MKKSCLKPYDSPPPPIPRTPGGLFYICLNRKKQSETTSPRALIFGMKHHLVSPYQVCSNDIPGAKNGPPGCHMFYIGLYREKYKKIFQSETIRLGALIFSMYHHQEGLYQVLFKLCPWGQKWPCPRCHQGYGQLSTETFNVSFKQNSGDRFRAPWPSSLRGYSPPFNQINIILLDVSGCHISIIFDTTR